MLPRPFLLLEWAHHVCSEAISLDDLCVVGHPELSSVFHRSEHIFVWDVDANGRARLARTSADRLWHAARTRGRITILAAPYAGALGWRRRG